MPDHLESAGSHHLDCLELAGGDFPERGFNESREEGNGGDREGDDGGVWPRSSPDDRLREWQEGDDEDDEGEAAKHVHDEAEHLIGESGHAAVGAREFKKPDP